MKSKPQIVVKPRVTTDRPDLDAMFTQQLIDRLRSIRGNVHYLDRLYGEPTQEERDKIEAEVGAIKAVLETREHVPNKVESKQIRREKQQMKQAR